MRCEVHYAGTFALSIHSTVARGAPRSCLRIILVGDNFLGNRDQLAGGDAHERSISNGRSLQFTIARLSSRQGERRPGHSRKATPMNTTPFSTHHFTSKTAKRPPRSESDQSRFEAADGRALVLGGGGSAGNAWLIGVVAGLFEAGLDLTEADLVIGTSAGSTAAAQVTSASPTLLMADILTAVLPSRTAPPGFDGGGAPQKPVVNHMERTQKLIAAAHDPADMRQRLGASALELEAATDGSWSTHWRETVATRLPSQRWPQQAIRLTAVDANSGESVVFDRDSGVELVDAVAASCASSMPFRIGENRFIDGGYRRNENADLAAGFGKVLVLSPLGGRTRHPLEWGLQLTAQLEELRAGGSRVETILPDSESLNAFGTNLMDLTTRPAAARAGYEQGKMLVEQLAEFWR